jgi:hypothetical protein
MKDNVYKLFLENLEGRHHLHDLDKEGRMIFSCILKETEWEGVCWIHLS